MSVSRHHDDLYQADQAHVSAAAGTNAVASLQAGHPFSLLLAEDDAQRAAALDVLLDTLADPYTRFARATNPLRARLTLERLLIQVIQGSTEGLAADPVALVRRIAERRRDESRVVLVIEQAETLHPEVLRFLTRTAAYFPDASPRLQVLFVGRPDFRRLLDDPSSGFDEQTTLLEQYRPAEPEATFTAPPPLGDLESSPQRPLPQPDNSVRALLQSVWARSFWTRVGLVGGVAVGLASLVFAAVLVFVEPSDVAEPETSSALAEMPEPGVGDPDPPVLQAGPPPDAATAALRQELEAYLIASGKSIDGITSAQRRAVYSEFLVWRARTRAPRPAP
jgi:hypothetical protein